MKKETQNKTKQVKIKSVMKCIKYILVGIVIIWSTACSKNTRKGFEHRGYLGWLIDLSRTEHLLRWPSVILDSALIADYEETLEFLHRSNMNEITVWGLFTNSSWEPEVENTINHERELIVQDIIRKAHQKKIKILCGLGIYSWGFDKIMEENPGLKCLCNEEVMDFSNPEAWEWQKKVIDYIMDNYDFDGFSMQSADRGGCNCGINSELSPMEYHAILNQKVVNYIRSKNKNFIIGIAGWGMDMGNPADLDVIVNMTKSVDYLIDVGETALKGGNEYRKKLILAISPCEYGSTGTPNVEPIQALPRNSYFVPTLKRTGQRLKNLYVDGGRACELYYRTRGNPGDEVTVEVLTQILNHPDKNINDCLKETLSSIYQPKDDYTLQELSAVFNEAEDAYFEYASGGKVIILLMPRSLTVPTSQYLKNMSANSLSAYKSTISNLRERTLKLLSKIGNQKKLHLLLVCLENILNEIDQIEAEKTNFSVE